MSRHSTRTRPELRPATPRPLRRPLRRSRLAQLAAAAVTGAVAVSLTVTSAEAAGGNLVRNPGFDGGTSGWFAAGGTLAQAAGRTGRGARLSQPGPGNRTVALNDSPNTVASTVRGHRYTATAWVRATRPGVSVALRTMEYAGSALRGQNRGTAWLTDTAWHRLATDYTAVSDGASIDLNVLAYQLPPGVGLDVDDVELVDAARPAPAPAPAPAPPTKAPTRPTATRTPVPAPTTAPTSEPAPAPTSAPTSTEAPEPTTTAPSAPAGYRLVWDDEFDGSSLDRSVWKVENNSTFGDGNGELACLTDRPQNVSVDGGSLHLTAQRESTPLKCGANDKRFPGGRSFSSGHISTQGTKTFTYGRFEIRARLPLAPGSSKGLWPAFWLRPASGGTGELDVLEAVGGNPGEVEPNTVHQTIWYDYSGTYKPEAKTTNLGAGTTSGGMHVYAVEWEPGSIRWYVDGALTYSRDLSTTPWLDQAFSKPFYMRLNLSVGGSWPGSPTAGTSFPASYDVDYVRVYQR